jgi:two-component system, OmpR family, sensor histidine kinase KdpD
VGEFSRFTPERLLVCVGPSPTSADLIQATKEMASRLNAEWFAVYVKTPRMVQLPEAEQNRAVQNLQFAEHLGAQTFTLFGRSIGDKIGDFASRHNITRIIAGKPTHYRWQDIIFGSIVDELVRMSSGIDVIFLTGEPGKTKELPILLKPRDMHFSGYGMGLLYSILATGLCFLIYPYLDLSNLIMVYLLGVMITAIHWGRGPAILNSVFNVLAFYFFFVPVRYSFTLVETHFIFTFAMMLLVALVISHLTILIRRQGEAAHLQERQTAAMHSLSRQLATTRGVENILQVAVKQLGEIFECQVVALLPEENGKLLSVVGDLSAVSEQDKTKALSLALWALRTGQKAGWGTQTSPESPFLYMPLRATKTIIGVLALRLKDPESEIWLLPEHLRQGLLESLAKQIALALEVEHLEKVALDAKIVSETGPPCQAR